MERTETCGTVVDSCPSLFIIILIVLLPFSSATCDQKPKRHMFADQLSRLFSQYQQSTREDVGSWEHKADSNDIAVLVDNIRIWVLKIGGPKNSW